MSEGFLSKPDSVKISDSEGNKINVQNPFPSDGDSVYCKDIDIDLSELNNFSGEVCDLFNDLESEIIDNTANNPKSITIAFNRTVFSNFIGIGCGGSGKSFSNVKVELLGSGDVVRQTIDDSFNNTKETSKKVDILVPDGFNKIVLTFSTVDAICMSNLTIQKASQVTARIQSVSELTNKVEDVASFRGALKVDTALVHTEGLNLFFFRDLGTSTTISINANQDDTSINVDDSTGFNIGDRIRLTSSIKTGQPFVFITNIAANLITLDRPLAIDLIIGDDVSIISTDMNVNGSLASPIAFKVMPPNGTLSLLWQLTRMMLSITDSRSMDDGKFGGITGGLENGVVLRVKKGDGTIQELTNWKTNGDIALDMFDVNYIPDTLGPAGVFGLRGRWTFTKAEFVVQLDGAEGDFFELLIQDDLTSINSGQLKTQGRLFGA